MKRHKLLKLIYKHLGLLFKAKEEYGILKMSGCDQVIHNGKSEIIFDEIAQEL